MKTKFLQNCIGVSVVIFAIAFFIRSIDAVHAAPGPDKFIQQSINKIGKYQASYSSVQLAGFNSDNPGSIIYTFLITDTETGKTVSYYSSGGSQYKWKKDPSQLPENPFAN